VRGLRAHTAARVALGRAGGSLPTAEVLDFAMAHAAARDAVDANLDVAALTRSLGGLGLEVLRLHSAAPDRPTYLRRPDLGRRLDDAGRRTLAAAAGACDVSLVVADGLSALAAAKQGPTLLRELVPSLQRAGLRPGPLAVVEQGRVAIQDEIGQCLGAAASVILIGERPGLGSPDSLGAYLVFDPKPGNTDAQRNCVSNIRPEGLPIPAAAELIRYLLLESLRRKLSGVELKDERGLRIEDGR